MAEKVIHKYVIEPVDDFEVLMPRDSFPISTQIQHGQICIWAVVDPSAPRDRYTTYVVGTGQEVPSLVAFRPVGTVQMHSGQLVLHVFLSYQGIPQ